MNAQLNWDDLQITNDWQKFKKDHQVTLNSYQNTVADTAEFITKVKNNSLLFIPDSNFEVDDEYVKKVNDRPEGIAQLRATSMSDVRRVKKNVWEA